MTITFISLKSVSSKGSWIFIILNNSLKFTIKLGSTIIAFNTLLVKKSLLLKQIPLACYMNDNMDLFKILWIIKVKNRKYLPIELKTSTCEICLVHNYKSYICNCHASAFKYIIFLNIVLFLLHFYILKQMVKNFDCHISSI